MTIKRIVANSAWLLLDKVLRLGGGLALTIWMARTVGPQTFGAFGFASAVAAIVTAVATLGLQSIVMRDMVREHEADRCGLVSAALLLRLVASIVLTVAASVAVFLLRGRLDPTVLLTIILVSATLPQALDVLEWALLSNERARLVTLTRLAVFCVFAALRVAVIVNDGTLEAFASTIAAEAACGSIALLLFARREGIGIKLHDVQRTHLIGYAKSAIPLVTAGLCVQIYMRADQLMIADMLGLQEAGLYAAAVRISEAWNFIPAAAMLALVPRLSAAQLRSETEFMKSLSWTIGLLTALSLVFALTVWATAQTLIVALYGPDFIAGAKPLSIHVFSCVFVTIGVASGPFFVNHGMFRMAMLQTLAGGLLNIGLNLALIPRWGIVGAAYAAVASQCLSALALNALHPATRPLARAQVRAFLALRNLKRRP